MTIADLVQALWMWGAGVGVWVVVIGAAFVVDAAVRVFRGWHDKGELP